MNKKFRNFIFDLDGTIIDSKEAVLGSIIYAIEKLGYEAPNINDMLWCIGPPLFDSFPILLKTEDKTIINRAVDYYREIFLTEKIYENSVFDGVYHLLTQLTENGSKVFIATSKPQESAEFILKNLGISNFFTGVYGASLDDKHSQKDAIILTLLETEKIDINESIMIGDRKFDMLGAKANGLESCGVLYGFGSKEELLEAGATYLVDNPLEILNFSNYTAGIF